MSESDGTPLEKAAGFVGLAIAGFMLGAALSFGLLMLLTTLAMPVLFAATGALFFASLYLGPARKRWLWSGLCAGLSLSAGCWAMLLHICSGGSHI